MLLNRFKISQLLPISSPSVVLNPFFRTNKYFSSNSNSASVSQTNTIPEVIQKHQFITNLYGIQVKKHIFPNFIKTVNVSPEELKFYQKTSPNYIVALVSKVLQDHHQVHQNPENISKRFYQVCTYCKVKYGTSNIELQGLYRCRIEDIKIMEIKSTSIDQNAPVHSPLINRLEDTEENEAQQEHDEGEKGIQKQQNPFSIAQILKQTMRKPRKSKKNEVFSLKVRKLEQLPLNLYARLQMKFKYLIDTYIKMHSAVSGKYPIIFNIIDLYKILDHIANECSQLNSKKQDVQKCLEAIEAEDRIDSTQKLLQATIHFTSYLSDIEREAQNSLRNKKFYEYYSEILKIAKQVVDGKKSKQLFLQKVTKQFYEKNPSDQIKEIFENEKDKYQHMEQTSMEAGVIKAYLEEVSKIPYDIQSQQLFDLKYAQQVLDEEHYGIKEVKQAILEIIAVGKLKKSLKGKIFCFVGGPGLGKTTFAKSVAKALNRKFFNISLGGVSDSSVLKGHRRTYIGAYSGKIIQALKTCGTNNPVILLDEIDKMGSSYHGDPRSQLLQILDPNQNSSFVDNFVDIPVDLSNVLFICSANYEQNISKPLLDRMEKIKLTSYTNLEKKQIFNRHLLRRAIEKTGVKEDQFILKEGVIDALVQDYCMGEPGVRYLQKNIVRILEKIAYKIVTNQEELPINVTMQNLHKYLGNTYFREKDHTKITKGVAISLGGGQYGGRLTYIEAFKKSHLGPKQHKRGLLFTGSLGNVFKEAMNISYSYARNFLRDKLSNTFLYENQVHIHAPEGAQKKEGSTDALTVSSALISLALGKQVKKGVGLTGELTLHGKVLRTWGIKEKILVAKRQKLKQVVIPQQNYAEVQLLSEEIRQGLTFHFVKQFEEVYNILFK